MLMFQIQEDYDFGVLEFYNELLQQLLKFPFTIRFYTV